MVGDRKIGTLNFSRKSIQWLKGENILAKKKNKMHHFNGAEDEQLLEYITVDSVCSCDILHSMHQTFEQQTMITANSLYCSRDYILFVNTIQSFKIFHWFSL